MLLSVLAGASCRTTPTGDEDAAAQRIRRTLDTLIPGEVPLYFQNANVGDVLTFLQDLVCRDDGSVLNLVILLPHDHLNSRIISGIIRYRATNVTASAVLGHIAQ